MKVLMAGPFSVHTTRQVNWMLDRGQEVVLISDRDIHPQGRRNYRFIHQPVVRGARFCRKLLPKRFAEGLIEWLYIVQYRFWLAVVRPEVVHVNWVDDIAFYLARAGAWPLVLTIWGSDVNRLFLPDFKLCQRRYTAGALAEAAIVIADARDMIEKCARLTGKPVRVEILALGIDTGLFRADFPGQAERVFSWRRSLEIPEGAKVVVSIRALDYKYGHDLILSAFARALPELGGNAVLLYRRYNPDEAGECERQLRRQAERLGILDRVRWMESVRYEQLPEIYALADLVVNYPEIDAFPVSFIEAAACERPLVTSRLAAYEGTFAEEFFRFVPLDDVPALAKAIIEELGGAATVTPSRLREARRQVEAEFDQAVCAERLLALYREAVGIGRKRG